MSPRAPLAIVLLVAALIVFLTGCASVTTPVAMPETMSRESSIVVSRDAGFYGSARVIQVFVDGKLIGTPPAGAHVSTRVAPGPHRVRFVDSVWGNVNTDREFLVDVADKAVLFRVGFLGFWTLEMFAVNEQ